MINAQSLGEGTKDNLASNFMATLSHWQLKKRRWCFAGRGRLHFERRRGRRQRNRFRGFKEAKFSYWQRLEKNPPAGTRLTCFLRHLYSTSYNDGTKTYFSILGGISAQWLFAKKEYIGIISFSLTHVERETLELPWNVTIGIAVPWNPAVWIWILIPPLLRMENWASSFMSLCLGFFTYKMGIIISTAWSCRVLKELIHVKHSERRVNTYQHVSFQ